MKTRMALLAGAALLGLAVSAGSASAMPNGLSGTSGTATASGIEHVRWVCNPWGRCWWRPNYYGYYGGGPYAYYGGPRWYGGPGWGWRRHWGWRRW